MQHLEVSGAVRHIYVYIYIYVIRWLKVKQYQQRIYHLRNEFKPSENVSFNFFLNQQLHSQ